MDFADKSLTCKECQKAFLFSAAEQSFYDKKGLVNKPKRCPNCRVRAKAVRLGKDPAGCIEVACESCSASVTINFKPSGYKPIYCTDCLHKQRDIAI